MPELDWGRSPALEKASSYWLTPGFKLGGAWLRQAAHMAGHVTAESAPPGLRVRRRVLAPPSNVIKAAAAEPGAAPILEASAEQECSPQERGFT